MLAGFCAIKRVVPFGEFCHLAFFSLAHFALWQFLPFGTFCHLVFFALWFFCHLQHLTIWQILPFGALCHLAQPCVLAIYKDNYVIVVFSSDYTHPEWHLEPMYRCCGVNASGLRHRIMSSPTKGAILPAYHVPYRPLMTTVRKPGKFKVQKPFYQKP